MHNVVIIVLLVTSIVGITFIVERGLALRWRRVIPPAVEAAVGSCRTPTDVPLLTQICQQNPSPLSRLLLTARDHLDWTKEANVDAVETRARLEVVRLERGLVVLEIVVGIAPLLGLVGTIYGLILLFAELGSTGMTDNNALAKGISLALRATLLGLVTAIPALVAWSYYSTKVETMAVEMETLCDDFLRRLYRSKGGA
jgi:biopolymer transport protein ExbB